MGQDGCGTVMPDDYGDLYAFEFYMIILASVLVVSLGIIYYIEREDKVEKRIPGATYNAPGEQRAAPPIPYIVPV